MVEYNIERLNFLVVDDNKHMRSLVKTILHSFGVRSVVDAEEGEAALKELTQFPADIIILDWEMDPIDGLELTRQVRTADDSPNPFVPIIMLTGHTEMGRVVEARDCGINEFLAKPVSAKKLYTRIKTIIAHPRPFIRVGEYFGPDRRRRDNPNYTGIDRRKKSKLAGDGKDVDVDKLFDE